MKTCSNCRQEKPLSEFHAKERGDKIYVYAQCKECHRRYARAHYLANKSDYLARAEAGRAATAIVVHGFIREYLTEHPCVDCGETDIVVLQFDHCRGTTITDVSTMLKRRLSLKTIRAEVAKCDVRCANCHQRRTARQFNWWTQAL